MSSYTFKSTLNIKTNLVIYNYLYNKFVDARLNCNASTKHGLIDVI